jgi:hypothetical protein
MNKKFFGLFVAVLLSCCVFVQASYDVVNVLDFGADRTGGSDSRQAFLDAINYCNSTGPRVLWIPSGTYSVNNLTLGVLPIYSNMTIMGDGSAGGTVINMTGPGFKSSASDYLRGFVMKDIEMVCSSVPTGPANNEHGFEIYSPTDGTSFIRMEPRNFKGDAWHIRPQQLDLSDRMGCGDVIFNQCFPVSCWGYAFNVEGYINATWIMCDINSSQGSGLRFANGNNDSAQALIMGLWWEGGRDWASKKPVVLENMGNQVVTFLSCNFAMTALGDPGENVAVTIQGDTGATVNLIGCCGYFWHKWIEDKVDGHDVACPGNNGRINYMRSVYDIYAPQDLNKDNLVNVIDFSALAKQWLKNDCLLFDDCDGADINLSGSVDIADLANIAQRWLSSTE